MSGHHGLIFRFIFGIALPLGMIALVMLTPVFQPIMFPLLGLLWLIAVLLLARLGWLPTGFSFFKTHPIEHEYGVAPPSCRNCGYDLRASPEHCPECGSPVGRIDGTIIRYLMSLRRRDVIDAEMTHKSIRSR